MPASSSSSPAPGPLSHQPNYISHQARHGLATTGLHGNKLRTSFAAWSSVSLDGHPSPRRGSVPVRLTGFRPPGCFIYGAFFFVAFAAESTLSPRAALLSSVSLSSASNSLPCSSRLCSYPVSSFAPLCRRALHRAGGASPALSPSLLSHFIRIYVRSRGSGGKSYGPVTSHLKLIETNK